MCDVSKFIIHLKRAVKNKYPFLDDIVTFKDIAKKFGINLYISSTNVSSVFLFFFIFSFLKCFYNI